MVKVEDALKATSGTAAPVVSLGGVLLETLINDTTLAIGVIDASGRVRLMSPGLVEAAGAAFAPVEAHAVPAHFDVRCPDGSRQLLPAEEPLNRARSGETFRDELVSVYRPDGTSVVLRCSGTPIAGDGVTSAGGIVLFNDVTAEWHATREQSLLRERLMETFNHELRTPLTSMIGHAEVLEDFSRDTGMKLPQQVQRSLEAIGQAGARLKDLADTVSALADLDQTRHVSRVETDLSLLVADVVRRRRSRTGGGVSVVASTSAGMTAQLDETQVRVALEALLENAVTHAPPGTAVEVRVGAAESMVWVDVADHGPGIPAHQRERLLRPFERGEVDLTTPSGRGLGLAIARTVAASHRGRLDLEAHEPTGLRAVLWLSRRA